MPSFAPAPVSSLRLFRAPLFIVYTLALISAPHQAFAAEGRFGEEAVAALHHETRSAATSSYELNTSVLPQLDDVQPWDVARQSPAGMGPRALATQRIDLTRWFTPDAPDSLGLSLGLNAPAPPASSLSPPSANAPLSLDLGVRWRSQWDGGRRLDITAWAQTPRRVQAPDALGLIWQQQQETLYGTRVELQWKSSRTRGLIPEFGAVGVQLQGGSRLVLRARKGGPMLYYRAKF